MECYYASYSKKQPKTRKERNLCSSEQKDYDQLKYPGKYLEEIKKRKKKIREH